MNTEYETLFLLYDALTRLGNTDINSMDWLMEKTRSDQFRNPVITNMSDLIRVILANNLLVTSTSECFPLFNTIKELLLEGVIVLPIFPIVDKDDEAGIEAELFMEEGENIEFKGSFEFDYNRYLRTDTKNPSKEVSNSICKCVVGMLNRNGGRIYLGVLEADIYSREEDRNKLVKYGAFIKNSRILVGIENDLELRNSNIDQYVRYIMQVFKNRMGSDVGTYINIEVKFANKLKICCIVVSKYHKYHGIWLDDKDPYIRENNETIKKSPKDFMRYLMNRKNDDESKVIT